MIGRKAWIGICGLLLILAAAGGYMATTARGFDSDKWKALRHSSARDNPRAGMLREVEKLLRPGMTQDEVLALLGEPDRKRGTRYIYDLGAPGFSIDDQYFNIEFDTGGKLLRHWIEQG